MRMLRRSLIAVLLTTMLSAGVYRIPPMHAVALDRTAPDGVYALEQDGTVSEVHTNSQAVRRIVGKIESTDSPADITSLREPTLTTVIVTANEVKTGSGRIYVFFQDSRRSQYWSVKSVCGGVDVDPRTHTVYFADLLYGRLMSLDLNNPSAGEKYVAMLPKTSVPSAVVFDGNNARVFVADNGNGNVYLVNLGSRTGTLLTQIKNTSPSALVYDNSTKTLYVGEASAGRIYSIALDKKPITAKLFASNARLRQLSGLSLRPNGELFVSDVQQETIFTVSRSGQFAASTTGGTLRMLQSK